MDMQKGIVIVFIVLSISVADMAWAELPQLSAQELVQAVKNRDEPYRNYQVSYEVEEFFVPGFERRYPMPEVRSLNITYGTMGEFYRYDVHVSSENPGAFPPWSYADAWNGSRRTQWNADSNHGDIFDEPFWHAFAVPGDFGLSLGSHGTLLGEELQQCTINTIRTEQIDSHECHYVEATKPNSAKVELWIDPQIGWRARKVVIYRTAGDISYKAEADWAEAAQSIWFPTTGTASLYGPDSANPSQRAVSVLRTLTVNSTQFGDLGGEDFEIEFPYGALIYDHIIDLPYIMGGDGELHLAKGSGIVTIDPSNQGGYTELCQSCSGSGTCNQQDCSGCTAYSGGSYSTCESSDTGSCTPKDVQCGTKKSCDEGQGNCRVGVNDCSCSETARYVTGC